LFQRGDKIGRMTAKSRKTGLFCDGSSCLLIEIIKDIPNSRWRGNTEQGFGVDNA